MKFARRVVRYAGRRCQIARQLDVNRPLVAQSRVQHAVDFLKRSLRITQNRRGNGELFEHLFLRVELADLVVQQRIFLPFLHSRRAADDDDR